jgi:hypothetical protein
MNELKVGDKVKCIIPTCILTKDKIYTVKSIADDSIEPSKVFYIDTDIDWVLGYLWHDDSSYNRFVKAKESSLNIPSATEAKEATMANRKQLYGDSITESINTAIKEGKGLAVIKGDCVDYPKELWDELNDLGYRVTKTSTSIWISWNY